LTGLGDIMRSLQAIAIAVSVLGLVACSSPDGRVSKADGGTGAGVVLGAIAGGALGGKGDGRIVGAMIGAVAGGIMGNEIGRRMDERDRLLAQKAEFEALERGRSGEPQRWSNPDNGRYGDIVPQAPYQRSGRDCRDYAHTVYMEGRPTTVRGTACRNPDGTWAAV
jgi:surface antigen